MSSLESINGNIMTQSSRVGRVRSYQDPTATSGFAEGGRRALSGRAAPPAAVLGSSTSLPARLNPVASLAEPYIRYAASLPTWERVEALSVPRTQVWYHPGEGRGGGVRYPRSTQAAGGFPSIILTLGTGREQGSGINVRGLGAP